MADIPLDGAPGILEASRRALAAALLSKRSLTGTQRFAEMSVEEKVRNGFEIFSVLGFTQEAWLWLDVEVLQAVAVLVGLVADFDEGWLEEQLMRVTEKLSAGDLT